VPGLPEKAAAENLTPLEFMRRYGAFEVKQKIGKVFDRWLDQRNLKIPARSTWSRFHGRQNRRDQTLFLPLPDGDERATLCWC
jgi:hypothetical protein